ncbi:MAG: OmpA family protein, partial [Fulvivirga sp.]|nr:OmpA family protein [Fulvivirga sp.]
QLKDATDYMLKTLQIQPDHAGASFELAGIYIQQGNYQEALKYAEKYLSMNPRHRERKKEAERMVENANYALEHIDKESEINPRPLPANINQFTMQYFPVITADQQHLIYTIRRGTTMNHDEDLMIASKLENGEWGNPESISPNINSAFNEGTSTISADGRTLIFISCHGRKGYGSCDLYISQKTGNEWSVPKNMGPNINSSAWDSQPSLSADGRVLYFISNRPGGKGLRDIWVSQLQEDGKTWAKPVNLGDSINTPYDEVSPFIHFNGNTLYFASNGRPGFGGFDIYYARKKSNDGWTSPRNIGYPVNTGEDQVSLFITPDGKTGYYSHESLSDPDKKGELYYFELPPTAQVEQRASYVKGRVYDAQTKEPLGAEIELIDLANDQTISFVHSDSISGKYLVVLPEGSKYAFYVNKRGYIFKSLSFSFQEGDSGRLEIDIPLEKVAVGARTVLKNIFFDFDKHTLKESSKTELRKVISFLNNNPEVNIEISGHTDNVGSAVYNQQLSEKRAEAVYQFLVENGINGSRLTFKGYGQTQPVTANDSDEARQRNRRIEFKIVK